MGLGLAENGKEYNEGASFSISASSMLRSFIMPSGCAIALPYFHIP